MADAAEDLTLQLLRRIGALERRIAGAVRVGCVAEVQASPYRVIVNLGSADRPTMTGPLPVLVQRAGDAVAHSPLSVGEAVIVLAPGGSDTVMFVLAGLPSAAVPVPQGETDAGKLYVTGDLAVTGDLVVDGAISATGTISAEGNVSSEGDVSADGTVSAGGNVDAGGDVVAGTGGRVRLLTHVHAPPLGGPPART